VFIWFFIPWVLNKTHDKPYLLFETGQFNGKKMFSMALVALSVLNQHGRECDLQFSTSAKAGSVPLRYMASP